MIIQFTDGSALETEFIAYVSEYIGNPKLLRYSITLKNGTVIDDVYESLGSNDIKGFPRLDLIRVWRTNLPAPISLEALIKEKNPDITDGDMKTFFDNLKNLPFCIST